MVDFFIELLKSWAQVMPLPWFTFIGALLEEVIAPVPSPLVMTLGGSLAAAQGHPLVYVLLLAITGTIGKTIGCYVIYLIADKFEDILTSRFGRLIGITHKQIEYIGKRFTKGWQDAVILFSLRALPIMPTAPVSFAAGLLRLDIKTYLLSSAGGIFVRNIFYLYLGFTSVGALEQINSNLASMESIGSVIVLLLAAGLVFYIYKKRREFHLKTASDETVIK